MRKAFALIELLVVITVLPFVMIAISGIFRTFIRDIPRDTRLLQENTAVLDMLRHLRGDIDQAASLPESVDATRSNEHTLLIELPELVVCYHLQDGAATRTAWRRDGQEDQQVTGVWRFPHAVISWQRRSQGGRAYAVELRTHLQQRVDGRLTDRLANSRVYFVNALGKASEVQ
jgi:type II secretory pathway pseudopilin PulG